MVKSSKTHRPRRPAAVELTGLQMEMLKVCRTNQHYSARSRAHSRISGIPMSGDLVAEETGKMRTNVSQPLASEVCVLLFFIFCLLLRIWNECNAIENTVKTKRIIIISKSLHTHPPSGMSEQVMSCHSYTHTPTSLSSTVWLLTAPPRGCIDRSAQTDRWAGAGY